MQNPLISTVASYQSVNRTYPGDKKLLLCDRKPTDIEFVGFSVGELWYTCIAFSMNGGGDMFPRVVQVIPMWDYSIYVYFEDEKIVHYDISKMIKNGAHQLRMEEQTGSIEAGKKAVLMEGRLVRGKLQEGDIFMAPCPPAAAK